MEYRIEQIGGNLSNRISLSLITKIEESDNELLNIINYVSNNGYLSHDELLKRYFSNKENLIIKNIILEYFNNHDDVIITVEYFQYGQNNQGEYYFDEYKNSFFMSIKEFNDSSLCYKISTRIQEINSNKKNINDLIDVHKEKINISNEHVKPKIENIICEYLETNRLNEYMSILNLSFEDFDRYIRENHVYIKEFIQKNWKYKNLFALTYTIDILISSFGSIYPFLLLPGEKDNLSLIMCAVAFGFLITSLTITSDIEDKLITKKIDEVKKLIK